MMKTIFVAAAMAAVAIGLALPAPHGNARAPGQSQVATLDISPG